MACTLTWNSINVSSVKVNGVTVSQPYTLSSGDVIVANIESTMSIPHIYYTPVGGSQIDYQVSQGSTTPLSDCSAIYIDGENGGGGYN